VAKGHEGVGYVEGFPPLRAGGVCGGAVPWNHGTNVGGALPLLVQSLRRICPYCPSLPSHL